MKMSTPAAPKIWPITPSRIFRHPLRKSRLAELTALLAVVLIVTCLLQQPYFQSLNYTFLIGTALLHFRLGTPTHSVDLNELIRAGSIYYSVFPLGAILSVLPFCLLTLLGISKTYPVDLVVLIIASSTFWFSYRLTFLRPELSIPKRLLLASWLIFGTWYLTNLVFAGAWQIALGFGVLGEVGALYFTLVRRRPFAAGFMFALAFGNRTEILLVGPVLLAFLLKPSWQDTKKMRQFVRAGLAPTLKFLTIPVILIIATMIYNYARFASPFDFGYAHIPGVLNEPWYRHGIFSIFNIWLNVNEMLLALPNGYGGSILLASPFLVLLLRRPRGVKLYWISSIAAIVALTTALWLHGNPGGWQYSYRYAMILLPWLLVLFIQWLPDKVTNLELAIWILSVAESSFATYLFLWTTLP